MDIGLGHWLQNKFQTIVDVFDKTNGTSPFLKLLFLLVLVSVFEMGGTHFPSLHPLLMVLAVPCWKNKALI
jgi:hypothetical protein